MAHKPVRQDLHLHVYTSQTVLLCLGSQETKNNVYYKHQKEQCPSLLHSIVFATQPKMVKKIIEKFN